MTKSTITRDELNEVIATYGKHHIAHRMANVLLAAMDSEPNCKERKLFCSTDTARMRKVISVSAGIEGAPLYLHAQPALVIPDEMTAEQAYEIGYYYGDPVNVFARGANWMRQHIIDSTLAAAQHDTTALNSVQSVVTVPGKWIPVSERIPEDRKQVILWDAEIGEVTSGHYSHKTQTFYHCGDAIENEITHWMPPPCAPQEVK